ncbi:MAG: endonuclease III [Thermodesulfobacteriota bacterium]
MRSKKEIKNLMEILEREYPEARCSLDHENPLELLVATILSAQCTDERVNQVTKGLFKKYRRAEDYARAPLAELEEDVRPTGFYKNKAKSLQKLGQALVDNHDGRVPRSLEEMVKLPGVGRKTANVVLATAFGLPGVTVDTHVGRLAQRLGLTPNTDPVKIEFDIMAQVPKEKWDRFSLQLIAHGRRTCAARKPKCPACPLLDLCPHGKAGQAGTTP